MSDNIDCNLWTEESWNKAEREAQYPHISPYSSYLHNAATQNFQEFLLPNPAPPVSVPFYNSFGNEFVPQFNTPVENMALSALSPAPNLPPNIVPNAMPVSHLNSSSPQNSRPLSPGPTLMQSASPAGQILGYGAGIDINNLEWRAAEFEKKYRKAQLKISLLKAKLAQHGHEDDSDSDSDSDIDKGSSHGSAENMGQGREDVPSLLDPQARQMCSQGFYHCPSDLCSEIRKSPKDMNYHIKTHTRPEKCEFSFCGLGFPTKQELERHKLEKHQGDGDGYYCTFNKCSRSGGGGKPFARKDNAMQHIRLVHGKGEDRTIKKMNRRRENREDEPIVGRSILMVEFPQSSALIY